MNKTLHKLAAHCAPPAPGVLRALVPGVLCGWGCAGLLALGHPWLAGALAAYPAGTVYSPVIQYDSRAFGNFDKYVEQQGLELTIPEPGDAWTLGEAAVTVLGPRKEYEQTNNTSIVLRVDFGETSFLFTGDMERDAEADLLDAGADLKADVLKVGHHGSSTSTSSWRERS